MQRSTLFGSLGYNRRLISSRTSFILQRCDSSNPLAGGCMPSGKRAERRSLARLVPRCNAATFAASDSFQPNSSEPIDSIRAVSSGMLDFFIGRDESCCSSTITFGRGLLLKNELQSIATACRYTEMDCYSPWITFLPYDFRLCDAFVCLHARNFPFCDDL